MTAHKDSTLQHQIHDDDLVYADETTLLAASPASTYLHRIGYATTEGTYWIWSAFGWGLLVDATGATTFDGIVVSDFDGSVITHDGNVVTA